NLPSASQRVARIPLGCQRTNAVACTRCAFGRLSVATRSRARMRVCGGLWTDPSPALRRSEWEGRLRLFKTYFVMGRGANDRTMWRNRSFLYGLAMQTTAPSECALE